MNVLMNFLTIFAWIGAVGGGAVFALSLWASVRYEGSLQQKFDALKGVRSVWPVKRWFTVALVCTVFLIAKAMS